MLIAEGGKKLDGFVYRWTSDTIPPLQMINVEVTRQENSVHIDWTNSSEFNVLRYIVESGADAQTLDSLKEIIPSENDWDLANYNFVDNTPLPGISYYRIVAIEKSGKKTYGNIFSISFEVGKAGLIVTQNPVINQQLVIRTEIPAGMYKLTLYNASGQIVVASSIEVGAIPGNKLISLPAGIRSGIYHLKLDNKQNKYTRSIVVQ